MIRVLTTLFFFSMFAVSTTGTLAQGRHDEKPHGANKPASTDPDRSGVQASGGRHDEGATTHGKKAKASGPSKKGDAGAEDAPKQK